MKFRPLGLINVILHLTFIILLVAVVLAIVPLLLYVALYIFVGLFWLLIPIGLILAFIAIAHVPAWIANLITNRINPIRVIFCYIVAIFQVLKEKISDWYNFMDNREF